MRLFKLMEANGGYSVCHTKGLTKEEADEMRERHAKCFPDLEYWVQPQYEDEEQDEPKHYNERAVDGWEDIYNYD